MENNIEITEGLRFKHLNAIYSISNIRKKKLLEINSPMVADIYYNNYIISKRSVEYIKENINKGIWEVI